MDKKSDAQIADEVMQIMINKYEHKDLSFKNATLDVLKKIHKKVKQQDPEMIERVIIFYGPEVKKIKDAEKLKKFDISHLIESVKDKLHQFNHHKKECDNLQDCPNCESQSNCFIERNR